MKYYYLLPCALFLTSCYTYKSTQIVSRGVVWDKNPSELLAIDQRLLQRPDCDGTRMKVKMYWQQKLYGSESYQKNKIKNRTRFSTNARDFNRFTALYFMGPLSAGVAFDNKPLTLSGGILFFAWMVHNLSTRKSVKSFKVYQGISRY